VARDRGRHPHRTQAEVRMMEDQPYDPKADAEAVLESLEGKTDG
jgi:hypothetical protein